ncbi:DNA methyltransferase [Rhizobium sp. Root73]|uniref:type I restriction-modification system subunit M n=1 Tax=unclassified Rhizobium TaxID=2613769 RepID=UPI00072AE794|nr:MULTISPECIES: class I SAM-dependent DNA methyltransferase [unclassified Rhizobium]KQY10887.1 DNA methyltransferase [Rhizobium sp. Root1334]KRC04871.1 DNA methyltransferase [Rhizobium sp. Root73]
MLEKVAEKAKLRAKNQKSMEETLWDSANKLRGSVEPSEYKHVVLSLIFLKFISDRFEQERQELIAKGLSQYLETDVFYTRNNVFYLPEASRWAYIKSHSKQDDIAILIDTALHQIEKKNAALKGALPDNYFSRIGLDKSKLSSLIDTINNIHTTKDTEQDIIGRVYEYFLGRFAIAEGKGKGEFYTPKTIVKLIAELIEPFKGKIYDPCCGSAGMFVQSTKFVESHKGTRKDLSIYGQEQTNTTYKLAKMNLAIRGISANLGEVAADTFSKDLHPDLKADYIIANPPFNLKDWRAESELTDDPRWSGYDVPPSSNANYGWILHMLSKLSENGVAGFLLANGALSGDGPEKAIRRKLVENKMVEAVIILPRNMFYTTDISVTLWILNKNKKAREIRHGDIERHYRDRDDEILFLDLRQWGEPFEKKFVQFSEQNILDIAKTYHTWQQNIARTEYQNVPEYCYSAAIDEVRAKDYSLVASKYIEFVNRDEFVDFDDKMGKNRNKLANLIKEDQQASKDLLKVFEDLGYAIKL